MVMMVIIIIVIVNFIIKKDKHGQVPIAPFPTLRAARK